MNLLFVTDLFPYPPHSGSAVISFHWARALAPRHRVLLLSALPPEDGLALRQLENAGISVVASRDSFLRPRGIRHAVSWVPIAMRRLRLREFHAALEQAVGAHRADAVVAISASMGILLPRRRRSPPVLFVPYDAESVNFRMRARDGRDAIRRAYYRVETLKWQFVETHYYPLADACVAVTEPDAAAISRGWAASDRARIRVIPNGVDTTHFAPLPLPDVPDRVLISGNLASFDTAFSMKWFLQAVLAKIRRHVPTATVEVVGRDPLPSLRSLTGRIRDVKLWGYVPDLRLHLAQASVYVAPLLLGSGAKNRVLEAMAMGRPVVATPLAIQGLRVQPGRDVVVATTEDEFADAVVELLQNDDRRKQIGMAAREAVVANHSWTVVSNHVEALLRSLVQGT